MKIYAIILAGGKGLRLGEETPKQFLPLGDKSVIMWSIEAFINSNEVTSVIIVTPEMHRERMNQIIDDMEDSSKIFKIVTGGDTRQESVYNALTCNNFNKDDILLFHDAARPFLSNRVIQDSISLTKIFGASGVYVPAIDTITKIEGDDIISIPDRENLFYTQTPQSFKYDIIKNAHDKARKKSTFRATDDVSLVKQAGIPVKKVEGEYENFKITTYSDYEAALIKVKSFTK